MPGNCKLKYLVRGRRIFCKSLVVSKVAILVTTSSHLLRLLINLVIRYIQSICQLSPFLWSFSDKGTFPLRSKFQLPSCLFWISFQCWKVSDGHDHPFSSSFATFYKCFICNQTARLPFYDHYTITIRSLYDHYTIIIRSLYDHYAITIRSLYDHYTITMRSLYDHYTIIIRSLYDHYTITIRSLYDHHTITIRSLYDYY